MAVVPLVYSQRVSGELSEQKSSLEIAKTKDLRYATTIEIITSYLKSDGPTQEDEHQPDTNDQQCSHFVALLSSAAALVAACCHVSVLLPPFRLHCYIMLVVR